MLGIRTIFGCVLLICSLGAVGLAVAEPLTFDAALELATRSSPEIAVQTAGVEAAQSASLTLDQSPGFKLPAMNFEGLPMEALNRPIGQAGRRGHRHGALLRAQSVARAAHEARIQHLAVLQSGT
jgi:hypothetical protein